MYNTEPFLKDGLSSKEKARREGFLRAMQEAENKYGFSFSDCQSGACIFDVWKQAAIANVESDFGEWELLI